MIAALNNTYIGLVIISNSHTYVVKLNSKFIEFIKFIKFIVKPGIQIQNPKS